MKFSKKYCVKIPKDVQILYNENQNFLVCVGKINRKYLELKLKLLLQKDTDYIYVSKVVIEKLRGNRKKTLKALRGTAVASLKKCILESSLVLTKKIKFIGVGYKVFPIDYHDNFLLQFKLGFSHSVYYKIPKTVTIIPFKSTFLYISGISYSSVTQIAATIRACKIPEPYKGKGILYDNEQIKLKEGKKV